MKINIQLSRHGNKGRFELKLSAKVRIGGNVVSLYAGSNIFVRPSDWNDDLQEIECYASKRVITDDIKNAREEADRLDMLLRHIGKEWEKTDRTAITKDWLFDVVDRYCFPDKYYLQTEHRDIYGLFAEYLKRKQYSEDYHKGNLVMIRSLARYEAFVRETDKTRKDFTFDADNITKEDLEDYRNYLRNERQLSEERPRLFSKILANYPANVKRGNSKIEDRGENAVFKLMKKLKAFFVWLNEEDITNNRPFDGLRLGREQFGTPYYITIDERNLIASTSMPSKHLTTQRDIFVFHCFVGCRVSDLMRLTVANISGNILAYTPHKTKDEGEQVLLARVPLHPKATELIEKYKGIDRQGRLFPFISPQKYNDAIKKVFTVAGITRMVEVRNALTGDTERRPINEVASSHLARRTFVGNAYFKVQDPNIIGKMSGHVEGSKAFARYRNIEDETLKEVINLIG